MAARRAGGEDDQRDRDDGEQGEAEACGDRSISAEIAKPGVWIPAKSVKNPTGPPVRDLSRSR